MAAAKDVIVMIMVIITIARINIDMRTMMMLLLLVMRRMRQHDDHHHHDLRHQSVLLHSYCIL